MWTISNVDYVKAVSKNLEERLKKQGMKLPAMETTPMSSYYRTEPDATSELDAKDITMFQELIGEPIWATEIGRVDILHEVLVLLALQGITPRRIFTSGISHICFLRKRKSRANNIF